MSANLANDFSAALDYSRKMRDTFLVHFYKQYSFDSRYVFVDKSTCSSLLQKRLEVDTIMQIQDGSLCIEEKIEQWAGYHRRNFALEVYSCTVKGRERDGWMRYAHYSSTFNLSNK